MQVIVNGEQRQIAPATTIAELLDQLRLGGKPVAVEVNLDLVPWQLHAKRELADGDRLEIVTLVGGG
jgi:thiamine biosynthesis protein ThiS